VGALAVTGYCVLKGQDPMFAGALTVCSVVSALVSALKIGAGFNLAAQEENESQGNV
jgi:hypothetical protein